MAVAATIAEFNPFHNGHAWFLRELRARTDAEHIIVLMSGDFTQRGEPAIIDRYARARMALLGGADIVLELPLVYACSSAEYYAAGAVAALQHLGVVDVLGFGAETADPVALGEMAEMMSSAQAQEAYSEILKENLRMGRSYAAARAEALVRTVDCDQEKAAACLRGSHNILAMAYLTAMRQEGAKFDAVVMPRIGTAAHLDTGVPAQQNADIASATAIRQLLRLQTPEAARPYLPEFCMPVLEDYLINRPMASWGDFDDVLFLRLLEEEETVQYLDVTGDLSDAIRRNLQKYHSAEALIDTLRGRNRTEASVRRALLHILLRITGEEMADCRRQGWPGALRLLGFRREAQTLLHRLRRHCTVPIIGALSESRANMTEDPLFTQGIRAAMLYDRLTGQDPHGRFEERPVVL